MNYGIATTILFPRNGDGVYEGWLRDQRLEYRAIHMPVLRKLSRFVGNLKFVFSMPFVVWKIFGIIKSEDISLLHVNGMTNLQPIIAGLISGKPVLWHWNDMLTPKWFARLIIPILAYRRLRVVVATNAIKAHYASVINGFSHFDALPAPIPPGAHEVSSTFSPAQLEASFGRCLVGFVGNLLPAKGCFDYIECMRQLCEKDASIHGLIVGGELPGYPGIFERMASLIKSHNLEARIEMVGFQSDVRAWLRKFDLLLFPSHSEACPITVLEAMDCGVPVVSYDVGEVPEMLKGTGLNLHRVGNIDGLVRSVLDVVSLHPEKLDELKSKLRKNACDGYSLEAVAAKHAQIYRDMLSQGDR